MKTMRTLKDPKLVELERATDRKITRVFELMRENRAQLGPPELQAAWEAYNNALNKEVDYELEKEKEQQNETTS